MTESLCAAQEYCLLVALPVTNTHLCPACGVHVHAFCGELCEDASIKYHTTCFKCFKKYGVTFKDPEDFLTIKCLRIHSGLREEQEESILQAGNDDGPDEAEVRHLCNKETTPLTTTATAVSAATDEGTATNLSEEMDLYRVVVNDDSAKKADKAKKRRDFIQKLTLSQCEVHHDGSSSAELVSIGGIPHSKLLLNDLMLFCATHKISGYRQKKKGEVLLLIAARVASDMIYASIGRRGMHDDNTKKDDGTAASTGKTSKKRAYKSKLTRPQAITKTGTYFRAISLWFAVENRQLVLATGKKMNRAELDVGGYRHKPIWEALAEQFNKCTGIPEGGNLEDAGENEYLDLIQSPHPLYKDENPKDFDQLDGQDLAQFIRWLTNQYYVVHKSVSGDHARFEDKVGEKGYLLYFHNMITETGAQNIESMMKAQLSNDVFAESLVQGSSCTTSAAAAVMTPPPRPRMNRKTKGPPSSTREKTDEAILHHLLKDQTDDARSMLAGPSTSSTKEEYIREKKRIAVRVDEVAAARDISAMARDASDAVDLNLKKWKATLQDLKEMKDAGFDEIHPIFLATKAAAEFHEFSFKTSLTRAKEGHMEHSSIPSDISASGIPVLSIRAKDTRSNLSQNNSKDGDDDDSSYHSTDLIT